MNNPEILIELGQNIALLLSLVFIYSLSRPYLKRFPPWVHTLITGFLFGFIGIIGMLTPIQISTGVIIDARVIVVALAGLFGGLEAALIASGIVALYRLHLGGIGTVAGLGAIFTGAIIGVFAHRRRIHQGHHFYGWQFLVFGLILAIQSILWTFLLPIEIAWKAVQLFAIPVLIIYPLGTFFLGMIFSHQMRRYESEDALKKSEENLRITLNSIGDGVIATDADDCIIRMNPVAENLTGWSLADATGQPLTTVFQVVDEQTKLPIESPGIHILNGSQLEGIKSRALLIAKDGTEHLISESGAPIRDENGYVIGVVLVFRDETEQARTEQELFKAKKLESVGLLAGGIAHDFNNLLAGLFGNIDLAKMYLTDDHPAYQYLVTAEQAIERTTDLTKQLLTFAKGGEPIKETLSLAEVITESALFSLHGSNVKLETNIASDLCSISADKGQLSQVISNLVINAQQAMPSGGIITISAENADTTNGQFVKIVVQDEGCGIAPEHLDRIFDPYFSTKNQGNGLGLASTHSIIRKHNGRITVDSHLNEGTTFTLYLPTAIEPRERKRGIPLDRVKSILLSHLNVLVLEDEDVIRDMIGAMLKKMGHTVSFALEGQEAIEKYQTTYYRNKPYDIVITDLTLPGGMDGHAAAQEILKINPKAKIIVSSGYATDPVMANYQAYGFKAIVTKPYQSDSLKLAINRALLT